MRRIRLKDVASGKALILLTNNFIWPQLTVAALYKNRWQVELFFKLIKQHLGVYALLSNCENSVKTQIWWTVSTYVLVAVVEQELQIDASFIHIATDFIGVGI